MAFLVKKQFASHLQLITGAIWVLVLVGAPCARAQLVKINVSYS